MEVEDLFILELDKGLRSLEENRVKRGGTVLIPKALTSGFSIEDLIQYLAGWGYIPVTRQSDEEFCIDCVPRSRYRGGQND